MCRRPVTFGGGKSSVKTGRVVFSGRRPSGGVGTEKSFFFDPIFGPAVSIAPGS